jgi:GNAT superfamily N-acetyltransferase
MDHSVREASLNDIGDIFVLLQKFATSFKPERASFERGVGHLIGDESAWLAVVECDGEVVGYCLGFDHYALYANGRVSWVEEIMVREDLRRMGIGRALMDAFEAWAQSRDSRLVALATWRAAPFYEALGYEESAVYFRKLLHYGGEYV